VINFFPPGGVSNPDLLIKDPFRNDEVSAARDKKLKEYFGEGFEGKNIEQFFVAFAEIYYDEDYLNDTALFYDYIEWPQWKDAILDGKFSVPNITTNAGMAEARRIMLEDKR